MTEKKQMEVELKGQLALQALRRAVRMAFLDGSAYDPDGKLLNSTLNQGQVSGKSNKDARSDPDARSDKAPKSDAIFHAIQELEVPAGASYIRLAVRDLLNNRTGTIEVRLPLKPEPTTASASGAGTRYWSLRPGKPGRGRICG